MNTGRFRYLIGCAFFAGIGMPAAVAAQTTGGDSAQAAQQGYGREIIVTARRREEALQEVPLAITAFSADDLTEANITRVEDMSTVVPSLSIGPSQLNAHQPVFNIRGQGQPLVYITNDPSVGIYVAEAVQTRTYGLGQSLFDLESVQVLKGPQGTLFGRNTTGGAILFQPRRPTLGEFEGYAQIRMGNYDLIEAQGAVSVPLGEKAGLRVGFNRMVRDGYVKNVTTGNGLNDEDSIATRAVLLIEPSDGFKNTTYFDYFHANQNESATRLTTVTGGYGLLARFDLILADQTQRLSYYETEGANDGKSRGRNLGITNVMEIELSPTLTFKNIANYRELESFERQNYTGTVAKFLNVDDTQDSNQYSFEGQLLGNNDAGTLNWIVGGYYFQEKGTRHTRTSVLGGAPNPRTGTAKNISYSVFAQADYELVENLKATLGLRYTWDERNFTQELLSASTGNCILCASPPKAKSDDYTYTASLSYQIDSDKLIYAATRRGYRAGGFNSSANNAGSLTPFKPETVTDYEIGIKADWDLGGAKLRTNLAGYYSDYQEIQRNAIGIIDGIPVTTILNAASAHITGFELETNLWAGDFEFVGALTLVDAVYDKYLDGNNDYSGQNFAGVPKWTYRLGARYTAPVGLGEGSTTKFSLDWSWRDSAFDNDVQRPYNFRASYGLLNGRIEFQDVFGSQIDFALWGTNLTDKEYRNANGDVAASLGVVYRDYGRPRMYGAELSIEF